MALAQLKTVMGASTAWAGAQLSLNAHLPRHRGTSHKAIPADHHERPIAADADATTALTPAVWSRPDRRATSIGKAFTPVWTVVKGAKSVERP